MVFTRLEVTSPNPYTVNFLSDNKYALNWAADERVTPKAYSPNVETGEPKGETAIGIGGSFTTVDISGELILDPTEGTPDYQLWEILLPLARDTMGTKEDEYLQATLTLELNESGEHVVGTGWIRSFIADRRAAEGLVSIAVSFNFLYSTPPIYYPTAAE